MIGGTVIHKTRLHSGLKSYKKYQPKGVEWKIGQSSDFGSEKNRENLSVNMAKNHHENRDSGSETPSGIGGISHAITYSGGKILMLDSKNWNWESNFFLDDVKKEIEKEKKSMKQYHLSPEYYGIIFYGDKIEGGYKKIDHALYLVNPNAVGGFISEFGKQ
ncbi:MAG: hypothetical protein HHAS10_01360 [Candidatus Altimarinota bacterium]